MLTHAGSGHPGGSLSVIDILTALYFNRMRYDPRRPLWDDRDRFVLSKGHCVPAQYFCMAKAGFFPMDRLITLRKLGSPLQGHPTARRCPASRPRPARSARACRSPWAWRSGSGSAGQDARACTACSATGRSRRARSGRRRCPRPSSARPTSRLDNLCVIVDYNGIQLDDFVKKILDLEPVADKWKAFGWPVLEIDGHDIAQIDKALDQAEAEQGRARPSSSPTP